MDSVRTGRRRWPFNGKTQVRRSGLRKRLERLEVGGFSWSVFVVVVVVVVFFLAGGGVNLFHCLKIC